MPQKEPTETKTNDRVLRLEGWMVVALGSIIGIFANYTLMDIRDNFKEMVQEVKDISGKVSMLDVKVALLSNDLENVNGRLNRDESHLRKQQ